VNFLFYKVFRKENATSFLRKSSSPFSLQELRSLTPLKATNRFTSLTIIGMMKIICNTCHALSFHALPFLSMPFISLPCLSFPCLSLPFLALPYLELDLYLYLTLVSLSLPCLSFPCHEFYCLVLTFHAKLFLLMP
jgi:hypothetical protein